MNNFGRLAIVVDVVILSAITRLAAGRRQEGLLERIRVVGHGSTSQRLEFIQMAKIGAMRNT